MADPAVKHVVAVLKTALDEIQSNLTDESQKPSSSANVPSIPSTSTGIRHRSIPSTSTGAGFAEAARRDFRYCVFRKCLNMYFVTHFWPPYELFHSKLTCVQTVFIVM